MIKTLGTRYPELGRVRLGEKGPKGQPVKGEHLRFSSNDEVALLALSSQLGGTVIPWPNGEQAYHLVTESASVDVFLPPNPIDTAYELWGSGGCTRRCDGERATFLANGPDGDFMDTGDCLCLSEERTPGDRKDDKACNVTVRLRLVIPDVPGVGVWICTSHSLYAAMELPGQVAVLESALGGSSGLIPATFAIEQRSEKKPYEKYARRYIVPVLRVRTSLRSLAAAAASGNGSGVIGATHPGAIAPAPPALEAGAGAQSAPPSTAAPAPAPPPPANPKPPAKRSAARPAEQSSGTAEPGWQRLVRKEAEKAWPDADADNRAARLASVVEETTGKKAVADLSPTDSNAVLEALRALGAPA